MLNRNRIYETTSQRVSRLCTSVLTTATLMSAAALTIVMFVVLSPMAQALKSASSIV